MAKDLVKMTMRRASENSTEEKGFSRASKSAVVIMCILWFLAFLIGHNPNQVMATAQAEQPMQVYIVRRGDTLWSLANRYGHGPSPWDWIDSVQEANGIKSGHVLVVGERLLLPVVGSRGD
jgi:nucleoid-associated protein YgaU